MPDSVVLINLKGVITKINQSLVELTGYSEAELIGQSVYPLVERSSINNSEGALPDIINKLRISREIHNYELVFKTKSGEPKTIMLSCFRGDR